MVARPSCPSGDTHRPQSILPNLYARPLRGQQPCRSVGRVLALRRPTPPPTTVIRRQRRRRRRRKRPVRSCARTDDPPNRNTGRRLDNNKPPTDATLPGPRSLLRRDRPRRARLREIALMESRKKCRQRWCRTSAPLIARASLDNESTRGGNERLGSEWNSPRRIVARRYRRYRRPTGSCGRAANSLPKKERRRR